MPRPARTVPANAEAALDAVEQYAQSDLEGVLEWLVGGRGRYAGELRELGGVDVRQRRDVIPGVAVLTRLSEKSRKLRFLLADLGTEIRLSA